MCPCATPPKLACRLQTLHFVPFEHSIGPCARAINCHRQHSIDAICCLSADEQKTLQGSLIYGCCCSECHFWLLWLATSYSSRILFGPWCRTEFGGCNSSQKELQALNSLLSRLLSNGPQLKSALGINWSIAFSVRCQFANWNMRLVANLYLYADGLSEHCLMANVDDQPKGNQIGLPGEAVTLWHILPVDQGFLLAIPLLWPQLSSLLLMVSSLCSLLLRSGSNTLLPIGLIVSIDLLPAISATWTGHYAAIGPNDPSTVSEVRRTRAAHFQLAKVDVPRVSDAPLSSQQCLSIFLSLYRFVSPWATLSRSCFACAIGVQVFWLVSTRSALTGSWPSITDWTAVIPRAHCQAILYLSIIETIRPIG